jgi:hypothetical protein
MGIVFNIPDSLGNSKELNPTITQRLIMPLAQGLPSTNLQCLNPHQCQASEYQIRRRRFSSFPFARVLREAAGETTPAAL